MYWFYFDIIWYLDNNGQGSKTQSNIIQVQVESKATGLSVGP